MPAESDAKKGQLRDPTSSATNTLDDALISRTDHRSVIDHIFFQASRSVSHEQSQAIARIAITSLVGIIVLVNGVITRFSGEAVLNIAVAAAYFFYSVFHLLWVRRSGERHLWRRYLVIGGDLGCTAYLNYQFGLVGLGFFPLYLWIMIGNGLRFGPHYLRVATLVGISGFLIVNGLGGVLFEYPGLVVGLLLGLLLMPKFFLVMIRRLADANLALKDRKEEAEHLAHHDVLTGLPNRALLESRLAQALVMAERKGTHVAVMFIDLDGFKAINDNYGHDYGDLLLRRISECLKSCMRRSDTVARLGGDEFIILAEEMRAPEEIAAIVEQLFTCSGRYYALDQHRAFTTWSCGVAVYPQDGTDSQTLIKNADTAMYRAKEAGSNQFRLYDPTMSDEVASQLRRRDELRRAVEEEQFEVFFQPQVQGPGHRLVGVEALLRWHHPRHGLLPPRDFLPLAQRAGLVPAIRRLGLKMALDAARRWRQEGFDDLRLHINVSPQQILDEDFLTGLRELLNARRMPAAALGIELQEGGPGEHTEAIQEVLETLAGEGIGVALDDFGAGNSSLDHLKCFRVDRIKIDGSLVSGIPKESGDCKLVEAILDIAKHFEIEALAEGVENESQVRWLREHRCELFQGDLFSPPLSDAAFSAYLHQSAGVSAGSL